MCTWLFPIFLQPTR